MSPGRFRFDCFVLDPTDRQLRREDEVVELSSRYLDALVLLVREQGRLVPKDRFMDEVWRGVPVTDEALTQCIRTLRKQLGDDAGRPRFIETVPKHGYRFVAPVEAVGEQPAPMSEPLPQAWRQFLLTGMAGSAGGAVAGILGGLFYGFAAAAEPLTPGTGASSILLVLLAITLVVGVLGAAGVSFGIAVAGIFTRPFGPWSIAGGAIGGLVVGGIVKLLGLDAFNLLVGRSPGDVTGAVEGAVLGGAVGLSGWIAYRGAWPPALRHSIVLAGAAGAAAGLAVASLGGRLMGGSLDLVARAFPGSRIRLDQLGALFGEEGFGPASQAATAALEGALFAACVIGAMVFADQRMRGRTRARPHI